MIGDGAAVEGVVLVKPLHRLKSGKPQPIQIPVKLLSN
jgi:hypothetical protein